jgi:hypothetical protein
MTEARVDVALIQPLVYSLNGWMELRGRLAGCVTEGGGRDRHEGGAPLVPGT